MAHAPCNILFNLYFWELLIISWLSQQVVANGLNYKIMAIFILGKQAFEEEMTKLLTDGLYFIVSF